MWMQPYLGIYLRVAFDENMKEVFDYDHIQPTLFSMYSKWPHFLLDTDDHCEDGGVG